MVTYEEHLAWLKKQVDGMVAEQYGFQMAKLEGGKPPYSNDAYLERRFSQGYSDGCMKLGKPIVLQEMDRREGGVIITRELLRTMGPCADGYKRFCELFPDGATLECAISGLVNDGHEDWGYWLFNACRVRGLFKDIVSLGYRNSGYRNSGDRNSGDRNSGDRNSGDMNSGSWNSGDRNSGSWNSGDRNSGSWNSGYRNSGYRNSGDWNSGDRNSGHFNCDNPSTIRVFGVDTPVTIWEKSYKPSFLYFSCSEWVDSDEMSSDEKICYPLHAITGGYLRTLPYKDAFRRSWDLSDHEDRIKVKELPNFNADIFFDISGIDLR